MFDALVSLRFVPFLGEVMILCEKMKVLCVCVS